MIHHVGIVLLLLWILSSFHCCHPIAYFLALVYLYLVHERYVMRLQRKLQFEERRQAHQRRVLSDSETVRWLNYAVEKIWSVCMEDIVSQKLLLPIIPWFLHKYKPWTVKEAVVQHLYMGRSPPVFTEMRVVRQCTDDDHLVLELGMNFRTADDMEAILSLKLRKRLGFGMPAKLHLMGMHVEGKVLIGVKFLGRWPFLGRLRVCFVEPPYFQMVVKPIFTHGFDVMELPGIAGWVDKLLALAFEQTLVEPNMLVVDVEKFASPQQGNFDSSESWFSIVEKEPITHAMVEVVEATNMQPSDRNGLADPYVKGKLGPYRFRTKTKRKTLAPQWHEEFKIPIFTWELPNVLTLEVCDKDHFRDDSLGDCSVNIMDLRDGKKHDMWLSLRNIKMGRLHLALTVVEVEGNGKGTDQPCDRELLNTYLRDSFATDNAEKVSELSEKPPNVVDKFEPIDIEWQKETGIWVHHPGNEVAQIREPRKGKRSLLDTHICVEAGDLLDASASRSQVNGSSSTDENLEDNIDRPRNRVRRGFRKIGSAFHRSARKEDKSCSIEGSVLSRHANLRAVNAKKIKVKFILEDNPSAPSTDKTPKNGRESPEGRSLANLRKGNVKDKAKNILKHAGKSCQGIKHVLPHKDYRKLKDKKGLKNEDMTVESDSSVEESFPLLDHTLKVEPIYVVSDPISGCRDESVNSKENIIATTSHDVDVLQKTSYELSGRSGGNGGGLVEGPSNPKLSMENS